MASHISSIFLLCNFVNIGLATVKFWIPNTNFDNPKNWDAGRVPCHSDSVIFPGGTELSVFVQKSLSVKEIFLPNNGELILTSHGEINIGSNPTTASQQCDGKEVRFVGTEVRHWYDPSNWLPSSVLLGNLYAPLPDNPIPHAEKIPCAYDDVVFNENTTVKVRIEGLESKVRTLKINGKVMNTSSIDAFLHSRSGRLQFQVDTAVSLSNQGCADPGGCVCGNDESRVLNHICAHVPKGSCPELRCTDPIKPSGSCCSICGALMTLKPSPSFQLENLKTYAQSFLEKSVYVLVAAYVFKTHTGYVQAVFVDGELHRAARLVQVLKEQFESGGQMSKLGIVSTEVQYSEKWSHGPSPFGDYGGGMNAGGIAALVIGLLSVIVIAVLFYLQRHRLTPLAFSFGRFENEDDRYTSHGALEMAVEMTHTVDPVTGTQTAAASIRAPDTSASKGFDNPFYDPTCSDSDFKATSLLGKSYRSADTRENPCYLAFESVEDLPPPAAEEADKTQAAESPTLS